MIPKRQPSKLPSVCQITASQLVIRVLDWNQKDHPEPTASLLSATFNNPVGPCATFESGWDEANCSLTLMSGILHCIQQKIHLCSEYWHSGVFLSCSKSEAQYHETCVKLLGFQERPDTSSFDSSHP